MLHEHPSSGLPTRTLVGGGSLAVGCVVIASGLSAFGAEIDAFSWLLPVAGIGLGLLFLHAGWRILTE